MPAPMAMIITIMISPSTYPVERKEAELEALDSVTALLSEPQKIPSCQNYRNGWIQYTIQCLYLVSLSPSFLWSSSALSDLSQ